MIRILRAFAWLRWRVVMNALERTGARDTLQRFSGAAEAIGPVIMLLLMLPTALAMAGFGAVAGYALAQGTTGFVVVMVRFVLLAIPAVVILGPFLLPAADRTNPVRLLLLPISRTTLYVAQSASAFGDMWNIFAMPMLAGVVVGLAAGGALMSALIALVAAVLLVAALVGLSSITSSLLHMMVRDRRRGELIALLLIVILPAVSILPGMLGALASKRRNPDGTRVDRSVNLRLNAVSRTAVSMLPTELFLNGARAATRQEYVPVARSLTGLAAYAALLHMLGFVAFRKVLDSPGSSGSRRGTPMKEVWARRIPGMTTGASAVALAQLRLAMRTPRGRSVMLSPLIVFVVFGVMMWRGAGDSGQIGPFHFTSGISLATVGAFFSVLSILPIAMNQFAVDGAGLTMTLLSPLPDEDLLAGKAAGSALIQLPPLIVAVGVTLVVFPAGSRALWATLPLALLAIHFIVSPLAAICSALFPREVNMNSIGRGSNAHGAAGLLGMLSFAGAGLPTIGITLLAVAVLERPILAPILMAAWCVIAYSIGRLLFHPARRIFRSRRESLVMLG